MKRTMQKWTGILLTLLLMLSLTACGAATMDMEASNQSSSNTGGYTESMDWESPKEELGFDDSKAEPEMETVETEGTQANRKLIYSYNADLQTLKFDETIEKLEAAVQKAGGYIEQHSRSGSGAVDYGRVYERSASYTLRIPAKAAGDFVAGLSEFASVTHSNQGVEDVTDYYFDSEARLNNLRVQETRLLELLAQAENIGDMITIEQALSDVRYQIESLDGTIRRLDNEIEYSRVDLYIQEVFEPSQLRAAPITLGERIVNRFQNSMEDLKEFGEDFIVWLIGDSVIILIWVAVITAAVILLRKVRGMAQKRYENRCLKEVKPEDK